MAKINVKIFFSDDGVTANRYVDIYATEGFNGLEHLTNNINPNHMQLITWIEELVRSHCAGEGIANKFNAMFAKEKEYRTIKCTWLRSERLKIIEPTERKINYCHTIEEAVKAKRVFTVSEEIVYQIPKRRGRNDVQGT